LAKRRAELEAAQAPKVEPHSLPLGYEWSFDVARALAAENAAAEPPPAVWGADYFDGIAS